MKRTEVGKTFVESLLKSSEDDALTHYGILGMKWGVRRSQEELDRIAGRKSEKAADKERIRQAKREASVRTKEAKYETKVAKAELRKKYELEKAEKNLKKKSESSEDRQAEYDRRLREEVQRLNLERSYQQLTAKQKSEGRKFVEKIIAGSASAVATRYLTKQMESYLEAVTSGRSKSSGTKSATVNPGVKRSGNGNQNGRSEETNLDDLMDELYRRRKS